MTTLGTNGSRAWTAWIGYLMPVILGLSSGAFSAYVSVQMLTARVTVVENSLASHEARVREIELWKAAAPIEVEAVRARQNLIVQNQSNIFDALMLLKRQLEQHDEHDAARGHR